MTNKEFSEIVACTCAIIMLGIAIIVIVGHALGAL